jgi:RHS repeat-associated protein
VGAFQVEGVYTYSHKVNDHIFFLVSDAPSNKQKKEFLKINTKHNRATLFPKEGGKRVYEERSSPYFYYLTKEVLPNGFEVHYEYTKNSRLKQISLKSPNGSKTFSWIKFDILEKKPPHPIYVETSDESHFHYFVSEYKERYYLKHVDSDKRPSENYLYSAARSGIGVRTETFELEGKAQFTARYFLPEHDREENKWKHKPHKIPVHADKVRLIENPIGTVATFSYQKNVTDVRDCNRILTRYWHNESRLNKIEYFDALDQLYCFQQFTWENELLKSRSLHDASGKSIFSRVFVYDDFGNIKEEILYGNLTGNAKDRFDWQHPGTLLEAKTFRKYYEYLPGFTVPTLEIEEQGPTYRYRYFPGTNLLTAKFTYKDSSIIQREFFLYDNDHLLIAEIIDDGVSEHLDDLSDVSERHIKRYKNDTPAGLPSSVSEYYLSKGLEIFLKETRYIYKKNKVEEEQVFDETGTYRYSLKCSYDSHGNLSSKTDPFGQTSIWNFDLSDQLEDEKEVGLPLKIFSYDDAGRLFSTQVGEKKAIITYDTKGRVWFKEDLKGNTTKYEYDAFSRCFKTELPQIKDENDVLYTPIFEHGYDIQGHLTSEKDPRGALTQTFYTTFGKPYRIIAANGTETRHVYNNNSTLAQTTLPCGTKIHYDYDIFQRIKKKKIYASSGEVLSEETWDYNTFHLLSYTDPHGLITKYSYDLAGRKISEEREDRITTFTYDALGFLERTSDGCTTHVQMHDVAGRVIEEWIEDTTSHIENKMSFTYKENRKATATRITSQKETLDLFSYDDEGHLKLHTDPDGNETQFIYTDTTKTTIDPLGNKTIELYDPASRVICVQKKDNKDQTLSEEKILYDRSSNKAKILTTLYVDTHPSKVLTTSLTYNLVGQMIRQVDSGGKITTFDYFPKENKVEKTLPSGITLTTLYDGLARPIEIFSSNTTVHYTYSYSQEKTHIADLIHNRILIRSYNHFGELVAENTGVSWCYDTHGRCIEFTLPDLSSIHYDYKGMHLSSVSRYNRAGDFLYEHTYTAFDPNGHVAEEEMICSLGTIHTRHDHFERPSHQTSPYLTQTINYGLTHLVEKTETSLFGGKTYTYDPLKQLQTENAKSYNFDSLGNSTDHNINDALELIATQSETFTYDLDGNPMTRITPSGTILYKYDALARLTEITTEEKTVRYTYDPLSRLYSKETTDASPIFYLYDQEKEIGTCQEGALKELKVLGLGIKGEIGGAVALELSQELFAPLHDFGGNIIAIVSLNREIAESYNLTAFGEENSPQISRNPGRNPWRNPWRFSSKRTEETGLIYFGHRFYDPTLCRWLTPDPAGFTEGINLYLYALNSPLNRLDLFGLLSDPLFDDFRLEVPVVDVTSSLNWIHCKVYEGFYRGIRADFVLACSYWHKLKFTPEELDRGSFNLFDHIDDLMPNDKGNIALLYPKHGLGNTLENFVNMSQMVYDAAGGQTLLLGFYSPCKWVGSELWRACRELLGKATLRVKMTSAFIEATTQFIDTKHKGNYILGVSHSEGGLIMSSAIGLIPEEQQKSVENTYLSIGLGPAHPLSNKSVKKAIDFYSKQDYITGIFGLLHLRNEDYDIRFVSSVSKWHEKNLFIADHPVLGGTYREACKQGCEEMVENKYKFYAGQTR